MLYHEMVHLKLMPAVSEGELILIDATDVAKELDEMDVPDGLRTYPKEFYGQIAPPASNQYLWVETNRLGVIRASCSWIEELKDDPNVRWRLHFRAIAKIDDDIILNLDGFETEIDIGHDFTLLTDPDNCSVSYPPRLKHLGPKQLRFLTNLFLNSVPFTLRTLYYINRKVSVEYVKPNHRERKTFTRQVLGRKKGSVHMDSYYTLVVDKMNDKVVTKGTKKKSSPKRKHTRIGHLRRVSDNGLFGKGYLAGQVIFIKEAEPGDESLGTIKKDYKVK